MYFTLFGVVINGEWIERGSMGMFAVVTDEKDKAEWHKQFDRILKSLKPHDIITVVDFHI